MSNSLLTSTKITRRFAEVFHSNCVIFKNLNRSYESNYNSDPQSGKPGPTIKIRKPNLHNVRTTWAMNTSDLTEASVDLTIDTVRGVDLNFSDEELALDIDDFGPRYVDTAAMQLASVVDGYCATYMKNRIFNLYPTLGTAPNSAAIIMGGTRKIKENLVPMDSPLNIVISPQTEAAIVPGLAGQYNPTGNISEMYMKGQMSRALGLDWYMSQVLPSHTCGSRTDSTPTVKAVSGNTITVQSHASGASWKAGDVFTVGTVYAVNPETKTAYKSLQQFTVLADAAASGTADVDLTVYPTPVTSGANQNVSATLVGGAVTNLANGAASTAYNVDLAFHKDAFAVATASLVAPKGMDMSATVNMENISFRFVRGFDIVNARFLSRMDIFFGIAAVRPEWACKWYS